MTLVQPGLAVRFVSGKLQALRAGFLRFDFFPEAKFPAITARRTAACLRGSSSARNGAKKLVASLETCDEPLTASRNAAEPRSQNPRPAPPPVHLLNVASLLDGWKSSLRVHSRLRRQLVTDGATWLRAGRPRWVGRRRSTPVVAGPPIHLAKVDVAGSTPVSRSRSNARREAVSAG